MDAQCYDDDNQKMEINVRALKDANFTGLMWQNYPGVSAFPILLYNTLNSLPNSVYVPLRCKFYKWFHYVISKENSNT
jgi:hypothetical protein